MKFVQLVPTVLLSVAPALALAQQASTGVLRAVPAVDRGPVKNLQLVGTSALQALGGEGLFKFSGVRVTQLRISGAAQGNRHPLEEKAEDTRAASFNGHIDAGSFVIDGERFRVSSPTHAIAVPDGSVQVVYGGARPVHLSVRFEGFDVSGQPMRPFLRTARNFATAESSRAGDRRFPPGSIAYIVHAQFLDDVLVLPSEESFSGAANTRALLTNFSKNIPFCLSYEDRNGAKPYAILFRDTAAAKGRVSVYPAKPGTVFCAKGSEQAVAEGRWEEVTVAGTKAVVLGFGHDVDPLDTGVADVESAAAAIAFVEPRKGAPGVRPGKLYRAGVGIVDNEFRFNGTAAQAIRAAMAGG
jgi:hypothetical protein